MLMVFSSSTSKDAGVAATLLNDAPIDEVPRPWPDARPLELIEATEVSEELQVTALVSSILWPSLKNAVALNCSEPHEAVLRSCGDATAAPSRVEFRVAGVPFTPAAGAELKKIVPLAGVTVTKCKLGPLLHAARIRTKSTAIPDSALLLGLAIMRPPQKKSLNPFFGRGIAKIRDQAIGKQREGGGRGSHPIEIFGSQVASDEGTILETFWRDNVPYVL